MFEFQQPIPPICGIRCTAVLAQEFWHGDECVSPANVLFLGLENGEWHRIAIDYRMVFWRIENTPSMPRPEDDSAEYGRHPVVDRGTKHDLIGRRIAAIRESESADAIELLIEFENGPTLALRDLRDRDATDLDTRWSSQV